MPTEIITAAEATEAQLQDHADRINDAIDLIVSHEEAFREATLEPCLLIGREIAKAQELFVLTSTQVASIGGRAKSALSRRDEADPALLSQGVTTEDPAMASLGFTAWLRRSIPRLQRGTAYKYATCFKALGLPVDAPETKIRAKVKDLRHAASRDNKPMPSLNTLYKAAAPPKPAALPAPEPTPARIEDEAGEARVRFHEWMSEWDTMVKVGHLEPLGKADLEPVLLFLTTCRDQIRNRIQTASR